MKKEPYQPRLSHAVGLVFMGCIVIAYAAVNFNDAVLSISLLTGGLFYLFSIAVMWWLTSRERIAFYDAVTRLAERLSELDPDQWQALGIAFPTLRIHWNGRPLQFIEDSDFTVDEFRRFMEDSDFRQISPMRNWSNGRDRRTWERIKTWLEVRGYVHHYSASGNHSWLWRGNAYPVLKIRYLGGEQIPELEQTPIVASMEAQEHQ